MHFLRVAQKLISSIIYLQHLYMLIKHRGGSLTCVSRVDFKVMKAQFEHQHNSAYMDFCFHQLLLGFCLKSAFVFSNITTINLSLNVIYSHQTVYTICHVSHITNKTIECSTGSFPPCVCVLHPYSPAHALDLQPREAERSSL